MARKFKELTKGWSPERKARVRAEVDRLNREITLTEIRKAVGLAQAAVAQSLGVTQSEISKLERRPDLYVSTLRRYIEAMHGELLIVARFPGRPDQQIALRELEEDST